MDNFTNVSGGYNKQEVNEFVNYVIQKTEENILTIKKQKEEIEINNKIIENKLDEEIEKIRLEFNNKINIDNILDTINWNKLNEKLEELQEELKQKYILINNIEIEEKNILLKIEDFVKLEEEYENLSEKLNELEEKIKCINFTKEYLNRAYEKMRNSITPKFTQNLSENISKISNNKYNKVILNNENNLVVENLNGEYISAERLSIGTIDQLYLCLRLSMIDEISKEKMPIILDEAFAYYDEERLENILKYLIDKSEENQVIIFTCTLREQKILDKLGVSYNLVELS